MTSTMKKIILKSSDGKTFEVDEAVALQYEMIKLIIEDDCVNNEIPLHNVTSKILTKVIEYCEKHVDKPYEDHLIERIKAWDDEFVKVDQTTLCNLIMAADYLNIKSLFKLTCQTVADMMSGGKSVEEIRTIFNIKNDFTPEKEEVVCREVEWAFK